MIMYRLYKGAKYTTYEAFVALSVSLTLCQMQDHRGEKMVIWLVFKQVILQRSGT